MIIFDGHNDTLTNLYIPKRGQGRSFFTESKKGQLDYPRAIKGYFKGGFFSIFTPTPETSPEADDMYGFTITKNGYKQTLRSQIDPIYAQSFTDAVIDLLNNLETKSDGKLKIVKSKNDLDNNLKNDIMSIVLHFEGAEAIDEDLSNLEKYYELGLRALGLVWSRPNAFGCGVHFEFPHTPDTGPELTVAGKSLVEECNRLGILVDLAHITEKGFWDVANLSSAPLVVTHADVYSLCPSTRNLTDEQIDAIGKSGGIIGVNFEPMSTSFNGKLLQKMSFDELVQQINKTTLNQILRHVDYIVDRIGINHVAFGSDFDGADMPEDLKDVTGLPKLVNELKKNGYSDSEIDKITYKNWLRVLKQTWKE